MAGKGWFASLGFTAIFVLVVWSPHAVAAGFNCNKATSRVEREICDDPFLVQLDQHLNDVYRSALQSSTDPEGLKLSQRDWLRSERDKCWEWDCIRGAYERRIAKLTAPAGAACGFDGLQLPPDAYVLAGGGYNGRRLSYQIDQSGHEATAMDVYVHQPSKPVVLILGAYEPTVWTVHWTPGTRILAVIAGGYHRQGVAGLPSTTPLRVRSYDPPGNCEYFYLAENHLNDLNPMSRSLFGRNVTMFYPAKSGRIDMGEQIAPGAQFVSSADTSPESFIDPDAPLAGAAGLKDAMARGLIRPATEQDVREWVRAVSAARPPQDAPPIAGQAAPKIHAPGVYETYVVLKPFRYPAGLYGGNSVTFIIPMGVPKPKGSAGHSAVFDFNDLRCEGAVCPGKGD